MTGHNVATWPRELRKMKEHLAEGPKLRGLKPELLFPAMCSGASELMHHKPKEGDRYLHPKNKKIFILSSYCIQMKNEGEPFYLAVPKTSLAERFDTSKFDPKSAVSLQVEIQKEILYPLHIEHWTWLPRIKQFQEMLQPLSVMTMLHLFYGYVQQGKGQWHSFKQAKFPDPTMEQLWMCFVWGHLYNKVWTHKHRWIKKI